MFQKKKWKDYIAIIKVQTPSLQKENTNAFKNIEIIKTVVPIKDEESFNVIEGDDDKLSDGSTIDFYDKLGIPHPGEED